MLGGKKIEDWRGGWDHYSIWIGFVGTAEEGGHFDEDIGEGLSDVQEAKEMLVVSNRSTEPKVIDENLLHVSISVRESAEVVVAWGKQTGMASWIFKQGCRDIDVLLCGVSQ